MSAIVKIRYEAADSLEKLKITSKKNEKKIDRSNGIELIKK